MALKFSSLDALLGHGFDDIIDVRSPAEFAEDHVPGAINLPVLSNKERAKVGTIYKQVSAFDGRKVGAALVIRNVADHIAGPLADRDGSWRPLVYCWRGGQRSGVFSTLLSEIGWRAETITGGYQTFRRLVHETLYNQALPHRLILLDGFTGTAKTALLPRLAARGIQTLDLEGTARHRGSLLGDMPGGQPAQKAFETALAVALRGLDPNRPVVVEAESAKIGNRVLPPAFWSAMLAAPRIVVTAPLAARARYLAEAYAEVISDPTALAEKLAPLRRLRGHAAVNKWISLSEAGDLVALSAALATDHYDPAYTKSRRIDDRQVIAEVAVDTLDEDGQNRAAEAIAARIRSL